MHTFIIVLCILLPIVLVVVLSNRSLKKKKRKAEEARLIYYKHISEETGVTASLRINLIYQLVILDNAAKKILIIDQQPKGYEHFLFSVDEIKTMQVLKIRKTMAPSGDSGRMEDFIDKVVLEIAPVKNEGLTKRIIFYDRAMHSIFEMAALEKEAESLKEKITQMKKNKLIVA
jgi:hypothetical protein